MIARKTSTASSFLIKKSENEGRNQTEIQPDELVDRLNIANDLHTHNPFSQNDVEQMARSKSAFKAQALNAYNAEIKEDVFLDNFSIEQEDLKNFLRANNLDKPGSTFITHSFEGYPGLLFRRLNMSNAKVAFNHYVNIHTKPRSYIKEHNLFLLEVPKVKSFEFEGSHWIIEEDIEKFSKDYPFNDSLNERLFEEGLLSFC